MYRIASGLALKKNCICLINGESVGQVASQTLQSMSVINSVTNMPVIRPLAIFDKKDIIKLSTKFDCYDLSIKPFEDCCTVYIPKTPSTAPKIDKAETFEKAFDYDSMVREAIENTRSKSIDKDSDLDLPLLGLEVRDVLDEILAKK